MAALPAVPALLAPEFEVEFGFEAPPVARVGFLAGGTPQLPRAVDEPNPAPRGCAAEPAEHHCTSLATSAAKSFPGHQEGLMTSLCLADGCTGAKSLHRNTALHLLNTE